MRRGIRTRKRWEWITNKEESDSEEDKEEKMEMDN